MKTLGSFINNKTLGRKTLIDEKSVFYVFNLVIREEYGRRGAESIKPLFFKDKKLFTKVTGATWANEIWLNKKSILDKVNVQLGGEEIADLALEN